MLYSSSKPRAASIYTASHSCGPLLPIASRQPQSSRGKGMRGSDMCSRDGGPVGWSSELVGVGRVHVDAEAVAGDVAVERLVQAGYDVAVAGEDRHRVALLLRLQRLLARLGHGVVEADDAVFLDLQGFGAHGALVADGRADARRPVACPWAGDSAKMSAVMDTAH